LPKTMRANRAQARWRCACRTIKVRAHSADDAACAVGRSIPVALARPASGIENPKAGTDKRRAKKERAQSLRVTHCKDEAGVRRMSLGKKSPRVWHYVQRNAPVRALGTGRRLQLARRNESALCGWGGSIPGPAVKCCFAKPGRGEHLSDSSLSGRASASPSPKSAF
jgi:hypothetical protein